MFKFGHLTYLLWTWVGCIPLVTYIMTWGTFTGSTQRAYSWTPIGTSVTKHSYDMIVYLWYRCKLIWHPVWECKIIIFERSLSLFMSVSNVFKLYPFNKLGISILIPSSIPWSGHIPILQTLWHSWTWSVCSKQYSASGVVSLICWLHQHTVEREKHQ